MPHYFFLGSYFHFTRQIEDLFSFHYSCKYFELLFFINFKNLNLLTILLEKLLSRSLRSLLIENGSSIIIFVIDSGWID